MIGTRQLTKYLGFSSNGGNFDGLVGLDKEKRIRITRLSDDRWKYLLEKYPDIWLHCRVRIPQKLYIHLIDLVVPADGQKALVDLMEQNGKALDEFDSYWKNRTPPLTSKQQQIRNEQEQALHGSKYRVLCYAARILNKEELLEQAWDQAFNYYNAEDPEIAMDPAAQGRRQNYLIDTYLTGVVLFNWMDMDHAEKRTLVRGILDQQWNNDAVVGPGTDEFDLQYLAAAGAADELFGPVANGDRFVSVLDRVIPDGNTYKNFLAIPINRRSSEKHLPTACLLLLAGARAGVDGNDAWDTVADDGWKYWKSRKKDNRIKHFRIAKFAAGYCIYNIYRGRIDKARAAARLSLRRYRDYYGAFEDHDERIRQFFTDIQARAYPPPAENDEHWRAFCKRAMRAMYVFPY